MIVIHTQTMCY